jgi:hypothetical protein
MALSRAKVSAKQGIKVSPVCSLGELLLLLLCSYMQFQFQDTRPALRHCAAPAPCA